MLLFLLDWGGKCWPMVYSHGSYPALLRRGRIGLFQFEKYLKGKKKKCAFSKIKDLLKYLSRRYFEESSEKIYLVPSYPDRPQGPPSGNNVKSYAKYLEYARKYHRLEITLVPPQIHRDVETAPSRHLIFQLTPVG